MVWRGALATVLTFCVLLTGATAATHPALAQETTPPDPSEDVLGWENGYWYNETIEVTDDDGLDEEELTAVVARAMARVEKTRKLEFKEEVPVKIIDRETYQNRTDRAYANATDAQRLHQNVKYEGLFMVNQSSDALELLRANQAGSVLGFYRISTNELVLVSDNPEMLELDEITLAHELMHALQDQHFNLSQYNRETSEDHNAVNGLLEGDANYVQQQYETTCEAESWGPCVIPDGARTGGGVAHLGLYVVSFQPYSDGPAFVKHIQQSQGWEGVNEVYEDPPASTEQVIHPPLYGVDEPTEVSITDRSDDAWHVLELDDSINYAVFGEAGMYSMFLYPSIHSNQATQIIPLRSFFANSDLTPYNYESEFSAGWDGDKLLPYVTNDTESVQGAGYVWKSVWDTTEDAREFTEGYRELLAYHGAEETTEDTFIIPVQSGYTGAVHIERDDNTVIIVKAPTVSQINAIRAFTTAPPSRLPANGEIPDPGADPVDYSEPTSEDPDPSSGDSDTNENDHSPTPSENGNSSPGDGDTTAPGQPGFGLYSLLVALLALYLLRRR